MRRSSSACRILSRLSIAGYTAYSQHELYAQGNRTRATISSQVSAGTVIYVDRTSWGKTQKAFCTTTVVTGFMRAGAVLLTCLMDIWVALAP